MIEKLLSWLRTLAEASRIRKLIYLYDKLWVRIAVIGAMSLVAIVLARVVEPFIPDGVADALGAKSVGNLLNIIADSMIAATIFSLTVMVSVHRAASGQWTPRVHRILVNDNTSRNVIAAMMGAYIFSLASLVFLETSFFGEGQVVVLFCFTLLVLLLIVVNIVRWAVHLQDFGSLSSTARKIEDRTRLVLQTRSRKPYRGGNKLASLEDVPAGAEPIVAARTGYIRYILEDELNAAADDADSDLYLAVEAGKFVFIGDTIAYATRPSDDLREAFGEHVAIGTERSFDEDPRFGFIVLGEVGSRALSPGINDPGTAIDVLGRMGRLLLDHEPDPPEDDDLANPRIWVRDIDEKSFLEDGFLPILRDGASTVEVHIIAQRILKRLSSHENEKIAKAADWAANVGMEFAKEGLSRQDDLLRLRRESGVREAD